MIQIDNYVSLWTALRHIAKVLPININVDTGLEFLPPITNEQLEWLLRG
jgi:hypothetical protein